MEKQLIPIRLLNQIQDQNKKWRMQKFNLKNAVCIKERERLPIPYTSFQNEIMIYLISIIINEFINII